jgi:two-component system cell cycle sensor histidine kinase/response regulator CckA
VYSEQGHGATFSILLPVSGSPLPEESPVAGEIPLGTETVLLVDDEPYVLQVGAELLRSLGYTVVEASGGAEALEIYERRQPPIDAVVLDMIMPGMSGGATFDALRHLDAGVHVLLASGYSIDGAAGDILRRGCAAFIQKPFARGELARKMREVFASPPSPGV